ncbi:MULTISPECIES: fimbria/pilus outer membrane usher protein [Pseudomonas]|uniref:fimbria/pilus outer membrane usher protein n=1 Tax=Pseudomonas TaxID=286 RepID=UPI000F588EC7|nr:MULTISPECIES: fimbria/pilus outer membrane usher protein [Pseudomonas]AZF15612.1 Outer membrane usher protein FIMD [Pseudomonas sp. R3-18-08]AZF26257.1 Outer membrane usher protein FIMD [Pseudomonas sp. R2-60-08W]AZF31622.1 Outer membrane usher protein FIMD [Pseudomonas sp. R4-35-07]AZF36897.1 Outer membrane usher protein FIMD [Pseudomonas sp. R4-39-08]AZF52564.1 Outer membrane usher protein FIMD [Pseudomonas sp. R4-34-07]
MFLTTHAPHYAGRFFAARHWLFVTTLGAVLPDNLAQAEESNAALALFNPAFLQGQERSLDMSRFERGNGAMPGSYRLDVYVNQQWMGRQDIRVRDGGDGKPSRICFTPAQVSSLGIDLKRLPESHALESDDCADIGLWVPDAHIDMDLGALRLDLSIAQTYLNRAARGYVDPGDWDRGVTAAFVDYNSNAFHNDSRGSNSTEFYTGINSGLNLGDWRLRHNASYNRSSSVGESRSKYSALSTYAQRDLTTLKSQITLGDYYTPSELFDSVSFTGVQVASDDRMLPDSQRGFAPSIRGMAQSNSRVTVRQAGNILYETSVAPGPFVIDDLYSTGYSGDLDVTVTEADGRIHSFIVPFASVAQLLRPGTSRYSVSAGQYRDDRLRKVPTFVQATYQRGISNQATAYTGSVVADQYLAVQGGMALSTSVGAFAFDVTQSNASGLQSSDEGTDPLDSTASGRSYRLSYSKLVDSTKTNFVVAAYRFSSEGYLSFSDYARAQDLTGPAPNRQRSRLQVNINQPLPGDAGSLYLSGSSQNHWNNAKSRDTSFQAGYSNSYSWGNLSLSASRTQGSNNKDDTQYMLTLSMPLGRDRHTSYLTSSTTYSGKGDVGTQVGLSGSVGEQSELSYGVYGSHDRAFGASNSSTGANAQYRMAKTNLSGSIGQGEEYKQVGIGLSGSIVAHPGGVTFSQSKGETRVIVEARGAQGASLLNSNGGAISSSGYGVVSGLIPYRHNEVVIDPKGMAADVELEMSSQNIAPRHGAIVMLKYPTTQGAPVLLNLRDEAGNALPTGAEVLDAEGNSLTLVGQMSRAFIRAAEPKGELIVRWGDTLDGQCRVLYTLSAAARKDKVDFEKVDALCTKQSSTSVALR